MHCKLFEIYFSVFTLTDLVDSKMCDSKISSENKKAIAGAAGAT